MDDTLNMSEEELVLVEQYESSDTEGREKLVEEHKVIITNLSKAEDGMIEMTMDLCEKYESTLREIANSKGEKIEDTIVRVLKEQIETMEKEEKEKDATKEDV